MATGWPMKTTYANGDVYSASDVNDTNGTINLLGQSVVYSSGKNVLLNGGFDIWQRGTSFTADGYGADRWYIDVAGTTTVSQETANLPTGFRYGLKYVTSAASSYALYYQAMETANVIPLRGKSMTVSGYVKIAGSYAGNMTVTGAYSTSTDALASQGTSVFSSNIATSATTTWTRFTYTFTMPSDAVGFALGFSTSSVQPTGVTVTLTGIQLEVGSSATAFSRYGATMQEELSACQRYFEKSYSQANAPGTATQTGMTVFQNNTSAGGALRITSFFKVTKRSSPNVRLYDGAGTIDKVMYNYTNGYTGTAVPNETSVDVYTDAVTTKNALSFQFTADAEL